MSDTPRTDSQTHDPYVWNNNGPGRSCCPEVMAPHHEGEWVPADFARDLERELAACTKQLEIRIGAMIDRNLARAERDEERALADRLANLLEDIIWDYDIVPHAGCSAALAAWKEARHE